MRLRRLAFLATTALTTLAWADPAAAEPVSILSAAALAYAGSVGASVAAGTAIGVALASTAAIAAGIIGGVTAAAGQLLQPKPPVAATAFRQQVPNQESAQPRRIIYGRARVAPAVPYSADSENDRLLHLVHVLAGHECDGLEEIWFDDVKVWDHVTGWGLFNSQQLDAVLSSGEQRAFFRFHPGTENQQADPDLVADVPQGEWSSAHRGRGVCYVYLRLWGDDKTFKRGIPRVTYVVRGRKLLDPRTGTIAWSENAALVINDWVLYNRYGYREKAKFWDEDGAVVAAANICDEQVALADGGSEARYRFGGAFDTDLDKEDVLRSMLTSCFGMVPREGPRRRLLVGAWRPPEVELTDEDLAGKVDITVGKSKADTFTAVRGRFHSPESNYLPDDYPEVVSDAHDPAEGDPRYFPLDQPFTPSSAQAQRIAKLTLLAQRQRISAAAEWKIKALRLRAGDTFMWTSSRYGWEQKAFEVTDRALVVDGEPPRMRVVLNVRETGPDVHDWMVSDQAPYVAGVPTSLPDPYEIDPPGLELSDELRVVAQQVATVLIAAVNSSAANARDFEVQARREGGTTIVAMGRGSAADEDEAAATYELPFVDDGATYEARARAITHVGSVSEWSPWTKHTVIGKTAPPADVTGFRMDLIEGAAHLSWNPVPDLDLSHYRVRHSSADPATFGNAVDVAPQVSRPGTSVTVPWQAGTYFVVAIDKSGNRSLTPARITTTITGLSGFNAVETLSDSAPFGGTHDQTEEMEGTLRLVREESEPFVADLADVSEVTDMSLVGFAGYATEGHYTLADVIDLGDVYTVRLTAGIDTTRFELGVGIGGVLDIGQVQDWSAIGGVDPDIPDVDVALEISTTEDDPAGTPTWTDWQPFLAGDYRFRGLRKRVRLTSSNENASPAVSATSATADMPDRVIAGQDLSSGAGALAITFTPAFYALKGLMITGQDMASGDRWEITGKTSGGFTITFFDSGGTVVDRVFDYHAIGYGEAA